MIGQEGQENRSGRGECRHAQKGRATTEPPVRSFGKDRVSTTLGRLDLAGFRKPNEQTIGQPFGHGHILKYEADCRVGLLDPREGLLQRGVAGQFGRKEGQIGLQKIVALGAADLDGFDQARIAHGVVCHGSILHARSK